MRNEWILTSDRLPEDERQVLIYAQSVHFVLAKYREIRTWENEYVKTWVTEDAYFAPRQIQHDVIAWMPLEEPEHTPKHTETHECDSDRAETHGDGISRQAVLDAFDEVKVDESNCTEYDIGYNDGIDFAISTVSVMPSAEPDAPDTNVGDMISRRDAIEYLVIKANHEGCYGYLSTREIEKYLSALPTADVVEVVRCRECWHNGNCDIQYHAQAGDMFYCGAGERRKDVD